MIDNRKCIGCGECIIVCANEAIHVRWDTDSTLFQKKLVEYSFAALKGKKGRCAFLNFLIQISPACDCPPFNDTPLVQDLGIMASRDPVAIDQASVDMVNNQKVLAGSCIKNQEEINRDIFKAVYPKVDWTIQLDYAEEIGLGNRNYELIKI